MKKSPNWLEEELLLALELYLAKDLSWLSKISDSTPEIVTLSYILQNLDYHKDPKPDKFRSVGSVRMKLSNFKSIDPRYGKSSLSNIGKSDRSVWNKYGSSYSEVKRACKSIIDNHFVGEYSDDVIAFLSRYSNEKSGGTALDIPSLSNDVYELVSKLRFVCHQNNMAKMVNACDDFLEVLSAQTALEQSTYMEHGGINQERILKERKIGALVRTEMEKLISSRRITNHMYEQLSSEEWCRATFHIGHPLIKEIDPSSPVDPQRKDQNGYLRYWKTVYRTGGRHFVLCKEWFESNRKYFLSWLSSIDGSLSIDDEACSVFVDVLKYIQVVDSKEVSVSVSEIKKHFPDYEEVDALVEYLLEEGVLSQYQGSMRNLNVDDYELLFQMIQHPEDYIKGIEK